MLQTPPPHDTPATRGDLQRERILQAALQCFIRHGFHAASIANIASRAGISQGLIYRYFASKREIVLEIVNRQIALSMAGLQRVEPLSDFVDELEKAFVLWGSGDQRAWNVALLCEITAEASRDEAIAAALRRAEDQMDAHVAAWLKRRDALLGKRSSAAALKRRALALRCLAEGLAVRAARLPGTDRKALRAMLRQTLATAIQDTR